MYKDFLKFSLSAMASAFLGSHLVYLYFEPMKDFDQYVKAAEKNYKARENK